MRAIVACALLLGGCDIALGLEREVDASVQDGNGGDGTDAPTMSCFGVKTSLADRFCFAPEFPIPASLPPGMMIDTGNNTACARIDTQPSGPELCIVVAKNIDLANKLDVIGSRPLVLIAANKMTIGAQLDASSYRAGRTGPGAGDACIAPAIDGIAAGPGQSSGGGAGGSFQSAGGSGGTGASVGGSPVAGALPTHIQAGCGGGRGGSSGPTPSAAASRGGGAVYLIAGNEIVVTSPIYAFGAGGSGSGANTGGGGGGSGGLVALVAPHVTIAGRIWATGGGGAQGVDMNGTSGAGGDGSSSTGGTSAGSGADGGAGARTIGPGSNGVTKMNASGGGGGGGAGAIYVFSANPMISSPDVQPGPIIMVPP